MGACYCGKTPTERRFTKLEGLYSVLSKSGYADTNILLSELTEIRTTLYLLSQHHYKQIFHHVMDALNDSSDNPKSQKIKKTVRRGVADSEMHNFFRKIFNLNDRCYLAELKTVFINEAPKDFEIFPTFSENVVLEKAVLKLYVNEEGRVALKRMMWVINNLHPEINYSPQIVNIVSLLLVYNNDEQTYVIIKKLINSSAHEKNVLSKFITFNVKELCKVVGIIMKVLHKKCEDLLEYLERKNIVLKNHIAKIVTSFGVGYFSFPLLARLLATFVIEGNKSLIKIIVSMFLLYSETLISGTFEDFDTFLMTNFSSQHTVDVIIKRAFELKLTRYKLADAEEVLRMKQAVYLYRPFIEKSFEIFKESHLQLIWGNLAAIYRSYRPILVYSSHRHGISLRTLLRMAAEYESKTPMMMAIVTESRTVLGAFIDCALQIKEGYIGENESFLFQLEPKCEIYKESGKNRYYAMVCSDMITFGGGNHGPALSVDKYIGTGQSYESATYENPVFDEGYFNIVACEVVALILS